MPLFSNLLFPAPKASYDEASFPRQLLWIPHDQGGGRNAMPGLLIRSTDARYLVLYFHRNGEDIGQNHGFAAGVSRVLEVHVMLIEFPGYGIFPGESSEEALYGAAVSAYRFVLETMNWPASDIIVMGFSIGAAVGARLACEHEVHGLIMIAPFISLVDAAHRFVGRLAPIVVNNLLVGNVFDNSGYLARMKAPTLIIHGQKDTLVPCDHGRALYSLCSSEKKLLVTPEEMDHNCDLLSSAELLIRPMLRFFALPDYNFDTPVLPEACFNPDWCRNLPFAMQDDPRGDLAAPLMDERRASPLFAERSISRAASTGDGTAFGPRHGKMDQTVVYPAATTGDVDVIFSEPTEEADIFGPRATPQLLLEGRDHRRKTYV